MTVPIITITNPTVPGTSLEPRHPVSGRRTPSSPSRVSKIDIRANMSK